MVRCRGQVCYICKAFPRRREETGVSKNEDYYMAFCYCKRAKIAQEFNKGVYVDRNKGYQRPVSGLEKDNFIYVEKTNDKN